MKLKLSVPGLFRSLSSLFDYAAIESCLETCKKNGIGQFKALARLSEGNPFMPGKILPAEIVARMKEIRERYASGSGRGSGNEQAGNTGCAKADEDGCEETETDPLERQALIHGFLSQPRTIKEPGDLLRERGEAKKMFGRSYVPGGKGNGEESGKQKKDERQKKPQGNGGKGKPRSGGKAGEGSQAGLGNEMETDEAGGNNQGSAGKKRPMTDDDVSPRLRRKKKGKPGRPRKRSAEPAMQDAPPG